MVELVAVPLAEGNKGPKKIASNDGEILVGLDMAEEHADGERKNECDMVMKRK